MSICCIVKNKKLKKQNQINPEKSNAVQLQSHQVLSESIEQSQNQIKTGK